MSTPFLILPAGRISGPVTLDYKLYILHPECPKLRQGLGPEDPEFAAAFFKQFPDTRSAMVEVNLLRQGRLFFHFYFSPFSQTASWPQVQARPLKLKKNFRPFLTVLEKILGAKTEPTTLLLISPSVG